MNTGQSDDAEQEALDEDGYGTTVLLTQVNGVKTVPYVTDMAYRPKELESMTLWEYWSLYEKRRIGRGSNRHASEDSDDEQVEEGGGRHFQFKPGHPQAASHGVFRRRIPVIPVLIGTSVPRRRVVDGMHTDRYASAMLALFGEWKRGDGNGCPVKAETETWQQALEGLVKAANEEILRLFDTFEELHECVDAKDDLSSRRKQILKSLGVGGSQEEVERQELYDADPEWAVAMMEVKGNDVADDFVGSQGREANAAMAELLAAAGLGRGSRTVEKPEGRIERGREDVRFAVEWAMAQLDNFRAQRIATDVSEETALTSQNTDSRGDVVPDVRLQSLAEAVTTGRQISG